MLRALLPIVFAAALLAACTDAPAPPPPAAEDPAQRDSVIALLQTVDRQSLTRAFDRLAEVPHTYTERLEQLDADGRTIASRTRTIRRYDGRTETLAADSTGAFDLGLFDRFVSTQDLDRLPANPVPHLLPEEPPYLSPRGRDAYVFAFAPDTVLDGRPVRVLAVDARPGEGDDQTIRTVRLLLEAETHDLVGMRLNRRQQSPLFGETSAADVVLQIGPDGRWLPSVTEYDMAVRAPLTSTRRFRLERSYDFDGTRHAEHRP